MIPSEPPTVVCRVVVLDPTRRTCLASGTGDALPVISIARREPLVDAEVAQIEAELLRIGLDAAFLRVVSESEGEAVLEAELRSEPEPSRFRWSAIGDLGLDPSLAGSAPPTRPAWFRPGWRATAVAWITDQLEARGDALRAPPTALRSSARSTILLVESEQRGRLYFKADGPPGPSDAAVTALLRRRLPRGVPEIVGVDAVRGWLLLRDLGPIRLDATDDEMWERAAAAHARLQRKCVPACQEFLALGCPDLRGDRLGDAIERLVTDVAAGLVGTEPGWTAERQAALVARRPEFRAALDRVLEAGIPDTVVHQDLVACNIAIVDDQPVFFDWSDTAVGQPFFGFDRLLDGCWTNAGRKARTIDAYLGEWTDGGSIDEFREVFAQAQRLRVLYEDVRWMLELDGTEPGSPQEMRLRRDIVVGLRLTVDR